jgi:hypothetical protein
MLFSIKDGLVTDTEAYESESDGRGMAGLTGRNPYDTVRVTRFS